MMNTLKTGLFLAVAIWALSAAGKGSVPQHEDSLGVKLDQHQEILASLVDNDESSGAFIIDQRAAAAKAAALLWTLDADSRTTSLSQTSEADLEALFEIIGLGGMFVINGGGDQADDQRVLSMMSKVAEEISSRRPLKGEEIVKVYKLLIQARDFTAASKWTSRHPESRLEAIPESLFFSAQTDGRPRYWQPDPATHSWHSVSFSAPDTGQIVVVSSPHCEFARELAESIETDPELLELFRGRSLWLVSPYQYSGFAAVEAWQNQHPALPMGIMERRQGWTLIDEIRATPWIYWIQNGKAVHFDTINDTLRALLRQSQEKSAARE